MTLSAAAKPFTPSSSPEPSYDSLLQQPFFARFAEDDSYLETTLNQEELDEIEQVEDFVTLQADLELLEQDHCIMLALRYGDRSQLEQIKNRVGKAPHRPS